MINNDTHATSRPMTAAERMARFSAATPTIIFNTTPADRSRNGRRTPRSVKHRANR